MFLLYKLSFAKIRKNIGRFLSVLFIVALGAGFFAGLRETTSDIETTLDHYYDEHHLMDFKIVSTMGLTEDDVRSLKELENIELVVPSYSVDTLIDGEAVRVHAIEETINQVDLIEGTFPVAANECIADATKYEIGDTLTITQVATDGVLTTLTYQVVGLANSPLYIGRQMGIASIGTGELESFLFVPKENLSSPYYTEIYVTARSSAEQVSYGEEYEEAISLLQSELETLKPIRETKRYEEILEEATIEIQKIEEEANARIKDSEQELTSAKKQLEDGQSKLTQAKNEMEQKEIVLNSEEQRGLSEIYSAQTAWEESYHLFQNTLKSLGLSENDLSSHLESIEKEITEIETLLNNTSKEDPNYFTYQTSLENLNLEKANIESLIRTKTSLDASKTALDQQKIEFEQKIANAKQEIESAKVEIASSEEAWNTNYQEYLNGSRILEEQKTELADKIVQAKQALNEIEKPEWYLLNRTNNNGYTSIWEDATKVDAISRIFPIFFIIVVALMCFNTMNRMIEEERGEIGILASLGYSHFKIINGYLCYVFLATIIGVTLGLCIGYTLIPNIIYNIYHANYILPKLMITIKPIPFLLIILITLVLMALIAIISCLKELKNAPAIILRPKAPKAGKKVFLERISFFWKRLSFTGKVTARNMFRYKKRIIMTVLGVVGSTALLLTGFGLRDSISDLADLQYGKINHYDALFIFQNHFTDIHEDWKNKLASDNIDEYIPIYQESFTFEAKDLSHDVYLVVLSDLSNIDSFITFSSQVSDEFVFPTDGVVITEKMAELLDVQIGDLIKVRNSNKELVLLPVAEIIENYALHYIYMNEATYEKYLGQEIQYNMIMANLQDETDHSELAKEWVESGFVSTINFTEDNISVFDSMVKGLNEIVFLIIAASCMLAFIVLYNLTTINIAERIREISTLKVLGFYDKEVSSYVYRETLFLTIIGIIIGLVAGIFLHRYVIYVAETDNIVFLHSIKWPSYIYSFIVIICFTIIVQILTHYRLKKIDMIESLKSVE